MRLRDAQVRRSLRPSENLGRFKRLAELRCHRDWHRLTFPFRCHCKLASKRRLGIRPRGDALCPRPSDEIRGAVPNKSSKLPIRRSNAASPPCTEATYSAAQNCGCAIFANHQFPCINIAHDQIIWSVSHEINWEKRATYVVTEVPIGSPSPPS
jgi:hypothetical protein